MSDIRYNISELFQAAFGINSPIFLTEPIFAEESNFKLDYKGIATIPDYYKAEKTSLMGTPIIGLLKFKSGSYPIYNSRGEINNVNYEDYYLPATTLFSFRQAKNITKTNVLGSNGTVKEIYGFDDWIIDVKGLCLDSPTISARDRLTQLEEWVALAGAINISSKLFVNKNIHAVVIESYQQESVQGSPGIIPFSMTLISDDAIELILPDLNI